jgi:hypothetical protein
MQYSAQNLCAAVRPVAACSAQLDTPQHTATLLSMLKMAQQMAHAEADLQQQEQHLEQQQQQKQVEQEHETQRKAAAAAAADMLTPPVLSLLRLVRLNQAEPQALNMTALLRQWFPAVAAAADKQQDGNWIMVGSRSAAVSNAGSPCPIETQCATHGVVLHMPVAGLRCQAAP